MCACVCVCVCVCVLSGYFHLTVFHVCDGTAVDVGDVTRVWVHALVISAWQISLGVFGGGGCWYVCVFFSGVSEKKGGV